MSDLRALERRVANLEKMIQVSRSLRSAFDLQTLLQQIIESIIELADCEKSSILLIDPDTGELGFVAAGSDFDKMRDIVVPRSGSIAGTIADTRQPIVVDDARSDPRFFSHVDESTGEVTHSIMGVPLAIGGRVIGVEGDYESVLGFHIQVLGFMASWPQKAGAGPAATPAFWQKPSYDCLSKERTST